MPSQKILAILDKDFPSVSYLEKIVKKNGFSRTGYGAYTSTYGKPRAPYVIKINGCPDPAAFKFYSMIAGMTFEILSEGLQTKKLR